MKNFKLWTDLRYIDYNFGGEVMRKIFTICFSILILSISIFAQSEKTICPVIQIITPDSKIIPWEATIFSVKIENETPNLKYEWSVSAGTIIEGQWSSAIKVVTTPENGESITAKVIIQGLPTNCVNEESETKQIEETPVCGLFDDYGKVSSGFEKAMLDDLFTQLLNHSETIAFFRLSSEKEETINQTKSRIIRIIKQSKFRGINKKRLVFAIESKNSFLTRAYLVQKDKELPECENCEIIKGADVK